MRNLFALALVLVTGMAPAEEFKGWRVNKGTVPQTDTRVQSLDALNNVKLTFFLYKRGRRLNGPGEPELSISCEPDHLAFFVTGTNPVNGPGGRVRGEARFDKAHFKVMQWLLTENLYQYEAEELENKSFVAQFTVSKQLDIMLPLLPNVSQLQPSDVQMLTFDLDGFAEVATEMRNTCPF